MPSQGIKPVSNNFLIKICVVAILLPMLASVLNDEDHSESHTVLAQEGSITFTDVTEDAGMELTTPQWSAVWGDYNNDGYEDLYVGNHFNSPSLYLNNKNGTFTDVQPDDSVGLKSGRGDWHGAAWGDYNNDGHLDLYVVTGKAIVNGSDFYINNGDETFVENAVEAKITNDEGRGRGTNWIDYDNDGYLDIFVANGENVNGPHALYRNNNGDGTFTDMADDAGIDFTNGAEGVSWADYDNDGYMDLILTKTGGERGYSLHRNLGNGKFEDTTVAAGLTRQIFPLATAWGDYDNDGDLDLYLGRSYPLFKDKLEESNEKITAVVHVNAGEEEGVSFSSDADVTFDLWRSDRRLLADNDEIRLGSGKVAPPTVPFTLGNGMSGDHIGKPNYVPGGEERKVYVWRTNNASQTWNIRWSSSRDFDVFGVITTDGTFTDISPQGMDIPPITYERPNELYRNKGDGTFELVTSFVDTLEGNTEGAQWIDFDNDGDLDLYVTNAGDTAIGNQTNQLYRNDGNDIFTDVAHLVGLGDLTSTNERCSAWADYDNDGFLDMFLSNSPHNGILSGPHKLFHNEGNNNHWLKIKLVGKESNRLGIGAKIEIQTGDKTQFREVGVGSGSRAGCHNSLVAHFGLGEFTRIDSLTITWPSGHKQILKDISADQTLSVVEDPPTITETAPVSNENDVFLNQPIIVEFNEAMDVATMNYLITPSLTLTPTWRTNLAHLTLSHTNFLPNTTYRFEIIGQSLGGRPLAIGDIANPWQFTAGAVATAEADLSISQGRNGNGVVSPGDTLTYILTLNNAGPYEPSEATITQTFNNPHFLTGVSGTGCTWTSGSTNVICLPNELDKTPVQVTVTVSTSDVYTGQLSSVAAVAPPDWVIDPNPDNNQTSPLVVNVRVNIDDDDILIYLPTVLK